MDELALRHDRDHRSAEGDRRRDAIRTALLCMAWAAFGIFLLLLSFHLSAGVYASLAYYVGLGAGNAGIIFTLLSAYRRGEKRGDW